MRVIARIPVYPRTHAWTGAAAYIPSHLVLPFRFLAVGLREQILEELAALLAADQPVAPVAKGDAAAVEAHLRQIVEHRLKDARVGGRGEPGFCQILGNVMNTAMVIGLVFVVLACVAFLFMDRINRSDMEDGRKKLITYGLFAGLVAISVLIFKLHSAGWIAERSVG